MTRPERLIPVVALAAAALVLAGCTAPGATSGSVASASGDAAPSATPTIDPKLVIAEHLVAQEGLAIALASNVLQTQLLMVQDALDPHPAQCLPLTGGGSHFLSDVNGSSFIENVYYDGSCAQQYLKANALVATSDTGASAAATVAYLGKDGSSLGSLATTAHADFAGAGLALEGTGTFHRPDGQDVSLGLACQSPSSTQLNCQGGVAQDFPALGQAIGSITPLTLAVGTDPQTHAVPFQGSGNSTVVAPLGTLSIVSPDSTFLSIQGGTPATGDVVSAGQAGAFVLFPPTPTGWTVTTATGDVAFKIDVTDDATRSLTGSITQPSTGAVLATLQVDASGTGTISYGGGAPTSITSWMLVS